MLPHEGTGCQRRLGLHANILRHAAGRLSECFDVKQCDVKRFGIGLSES